MKVHSMFSVLMFVFFIAPSTSFSEPNENMVIIPGGCYDMGNTFDNEKRFIPEHPVHRVCVDEFSLGKYEVTNKEYAEFLNSYGGDRNKSEKREMLINISGFFEGERCRISRKEGRFYVDDGYDKYPVLYVSWIGATEYAKFYDKRLPTEAEWEYAAREGGKKIKYSWGNGDPSKEKGANIPDGSVRRKVKGWDVVNWKQWPGYDDNFPYAAPVGSFSPNALGLHDMTGNVWEWCSDFYEAHFYKISPINNPEVKFGETHVMRGGSWLSPLKNLRVAARARHYPDAEHATWGFRIADDL